MKLPLLLLGAVHSITASVAEEPRAQRRQLRPIQDGSAAGVSTCGTDESTIPEDDMWLRFNKVIFPDGIPDEARSALPLLPSDYPICSTTASWLRQSTCWSVILQEECAECHGIDIRGIIEKLGGLPTHPSWNASSPYWDDLREVIKARKARLAGEPLISSLGRVPYIWENFTLADAAEAVHNEYPGKNQALHIEYLIKQGAEMDRDVLPSKNRVDFLRKEVTLAELNTWAIAIIAPVNFGSKWHAGRARPEEIAWYITTYEGTAEDMIVKGIPADIVNDVLAMNLTKAVDFTAFPEGCPTHPSWPAMHSAASVASFWLSVVMNLNHDQICESKAIDWGVSYARTIAGVHFPTDNTFGLNLGQELLAMHLPSLLESRFGADPDKVRAKIARMRHDWRDYRKGDCFVMTSSN